MFLIGIRKNHLSVALIYHAISESGNHHKFSGVSLIHLLLRTLEFTTRKVSSLSHKRLHYITTVMDIDASIHALLILPHLQCYNVLHRCLLFLADILQNTYSIKTYVLLHFEHKNGITIIIKLDRAIQLRLVALYHSLKMIVTSFLHSKCNRTYIFME